MKKEQSNPYPDTDIEIPLEALPRNNHRIEDAIKEGLHNPLKGYRAVAFVGDNGNICLRFNAEYYVILTPETAEHFHGLLGTCIGNKDDE